MFARLWHGGRNVPLLYGRLDLRQKRDGANFFANGAAPSGVLEHSGALKDPERIRDSWYKTYGGSANSGKVAMLEEDMKYTQISIAPEQAQFLETRKFQINEIARFFRVPVWRSKHAHRITVIPEEAEIVRRIFAMYLDGYGMVTIGQKLNAEG